MRNKIENLHEESIRKWLDYDFAFYSKLNKEIRALRIQKLQCEQELSKLQASTFNNELTLSANYEEYERLKNTSDDISRSLKLLDEQCNLENSKIANQFKPENISTIEELNALCRNTKAELIILEDVEIDFGLAAVIQMRAKSASDKGNSLFILYFSNFKKLVQSDQLINSVTKLSFLQHGNRGFGYERAVSVYMDHLPDLKEIVLRGCGTARAPIKKQHTYEVKLGLKSIDKSTKIAATYDEKLPIQGETTLIIQQKEDEDGKILTKASWRAIDPVTNKTVLHEVVDIPNMPKITEENPSDEQLTALECIPEIPLLKHSISYVRPLKTAFFNKIQTISGEELNRTKKVVRRARTELGPSRNDLLSKVLSNMTPAQKDRVSVKAYVGGYEVHQGRIIPIKEHGQGNLPKAVRVGPIPK